LAARVAAAGLDIVDSDEDEVEAGGEGINLDRGVDWA
jgi:hypothetical protein